MDQPTPLRAIPFPIIRSQQTEYSSNKLIFDLCKKLGGTRLRPTNLAIVMLTSSLQWVTFAIPDLTPALASVIVTQIAGAPRQNADFQHDLHARLVDALPGQHLGSCTDDLAAIGA